MANALIQGLTMSGLYQPEQILASDTDQNRLEAVSKHHGIKGYPGNNDLVRDSNILLIAVKPQVIQDVLEEIKDGIRDDHLMISIAAGIPTTLILSIIGRDIPVIRVMPNTPALIQKGVSALAPSKKVTSEQMDIARAIFTAVGETVAVNEDMMNAVTALSGSGPGFVFQIMECFVSAGERLGFDADTALRLVARTFLGSTALADTSNLSLAQLREMVTSPGGTTAAGLKYFDENGLATIIQGAVKAAYDRGVELGKGK